MMKSVKFIALITLLLVFACHPASKTGGGKDQIEIVFLQMNDVYEISPLSDGSGGLARVATIRKQLLAKNPNTYTIIAGDFISPSVIGSLKYDGKSIRGKQMIECLNSVGVDYAVFGNHEFDYDKQSDLQARLDESNFPWLAANARFKPDPATDATKPFFKNKNGATENCPDEVVLTVKDADGTEVKLGLFGVLINTGRKPWVTYSDPFDAARISREKLRAKGADIVVGITHLNVEDDKKLAAMFPTIPLLMGGHDHDNQIHKVGPCTVAKADANAKTVYIHTLTYNKTTKKVLLKSELRKVNNSIPDDPETAAVVAKWEKIKSESLVSSGFDPNAKVVDLKEPLDCREALIRFNQAPVGKVLTDAMLKAGRVNPECAIVNSGSLRIDDVLTGTLYQIDLVRMLPFGGSIVEAEMRGSLLLKTLETGYTNKSNGGYLQYGNIRRDDASGKWLVQDKSLDVNKIYRVAIASFLLTGNEQNMSFLKTEASKDGKGTTNPDVLYVHAPDPKDKTDMRNDIRWALIDYWK